jgi:1,4-dihydroxy-2-naphthoate polyprenyltransferase
MRDSVRGVWLEIRVIPVLLWSFSAITVGSALAAHDGEFHTAYYLGAVTLGVLIQGLLAHTVNEIEDWRSGTDGHPSPRVISGGSKVVTSGLLSTDALAIVFWASLAATVVLGLLMVWSRGLVMLPFGLAGVAGAILYTMPPVRAAYRPFVGEAVAFLCVVLCVTGAALLQAPRISLTVGIAAVAVAAYAVSMLMMHHYLDREADMAADPQKRTSIVVLGLVAGHRYAVGWACLALAAAALAAVREPLLLPLVIAYLGGVAAQVNCDPADLASVTRSELAVIACGVVGALGAAAFLVPPLAVTLPIAAGLVALEMKLAVPPPVEEAA